MAGDLSAIDTAVYSLLASDPALLALLPDGVFWDPAPAGSLRFAVVSRPPELERANVFGGIGWERVQYVAKAVVQSSSVTVSNDAGLRIHELLETGLLDFTGGEYRVMHIERTIAIRYPETQAGNVSMQWQHCGGQYVVMLCPDN